MRTINYCCSCSFYTATLYIERAPIYSLHSCAPGLRVRALQSVNNKTAATIRFARDLKSTGRTLSEVVLCTSVQLCRYFASTR